MRGNDSVCLIQPLQEALPYLRQGPGNHVLYLLLCIRPLPERIKYSGQPGDVDPQRWIYPTPDIESTPGRCQSSSL